MHPLVFFLELQPKNPHPHQQKISKDQHDISSGSVLNDLHLKAEVCTDKSQKDCRPLYLGSSREDGIGSDVGEGEFFRNEDDFENGENDVVFFCRGRR